MNKLIKFFVTIGFSFIGFAASEQDVEMADAMRTNGKIYVVVAIVLVILIGFIGYLISIDRKVNNLEKRFPTKK